MAGASGRPPTAAARSILNEGSLTGTQAPKPWCKSARHSVNKHGLNNQKRLSPSGTLPTHEQSTNRGIRAFNGDVHCEPWEQRERARGEGRAELRKWDDTRSALLSFLWRLYSMKGFVSFLLLWCPMDSNTLWEPSIESSFSRDLEEQGRDTYWAKSDLTYRWKGRWANCKNRSPEPPGKMK